MTLSPLQFAKEWEQQKSSVVSSASGDRGLLHLRNFWQHLSGHFEEPAYRSYFDEYCSLMLPLLNETALSDLTPVELERLSGIIETLVDTNKSIPELRIALTRIYESAARVNFYVGCLKSGLQYLAKSLTTEAPDISESEFSELTEFVALQHLTDQVSSRHELLAKALRDQLSEWQAERRVVSNECAYCLLVDSGNPPSEPRGRLKLLQGDVEVAGNHSATDKVTFADIVVAPDDPLIGGAYRSLESVRLLLQREGMSHLAKKRFNANFRISGTDHRLTGESMGLAFALVAYTQLLKSEAHRVERFNSAEVAVTGILDDKGTLQPVNDETLAVKVARTFFSHIRYLVVPESNFETARHEISRLQAEYPRRQLLLVGVRTLADAVTDLNIIRSERVCIGQWVGKQAAKYSRMTKVQVPMLALLSYLMLCLIYPKAWIFFDDNPAFVRPVMETGTIEVFNADSTRLWKYQFPNAFNENFAEPQIQTMMMATDIDRDGDNEVLAIALNENDVEENAWLYVFGKKGNILFRRYLAIPNEYPGDTDSTTYHGFAIHPVKLLDTTYILTLATQILPARCHIRLWDANGDSLLWYIQAGGAQFRMTRDIDLDGSEEMIFSAFNNRLGCATFFALNLSTKSGCSPPYEDAYHDLSKLKRASDFFYAAFPPTDLCDRDCSARYNQPGSIGLRDRNGGFIDVYTSESQIQNCDVIYSLDRGFRAKNVAFTDGYVERRKDLIEAGELPSIPDSAYSANILNAVRYWTADGWITEGELRDRQTGTPTP